MSGFQRSSEPVRAIEAVLQEALDMPSTEPTSFCADDPYLTDAQRLVLQLHQAEQGQVLPLRQGNESIGAWLVLRTWDDPSDTAPIAPFVVAQTATWIDLFRHTEVSAWDRLVRCGETCLRRKVVAMVIGVLAASLVIPIPHRVSMPCVVEPVTRRIITIPYEGRLHEARAKAGDLVEADQIVALMDGHEIELQLASVTADLQRAKKQRDTNLANHDTSMAQIAALEVERLELQQQLLRDRIGHLEIRSPVAGVVISGDPRKTEGARFTMGQTILEIGPLDDMVLELEIRAEDIAYTRLGQHVRFRFESLPYQHWDGTIEEIRPRAETRANEHVFVAETRLAPGSVRLLPGMRGRGTITGERRAIGWILFHRFAEKGLLWFGW